MQLHADQGEPDLRSYLDIARRRKWIIALTTLAIVGLAVGLSLVQSPTYRATAEILVETDAPQQLFDPVTGQPFDPARDIQNEIEFLGSDTVSDAVADELATAADVAFSAREDADIIQVAATGGDAEVAADTANTYATVYIQQRRAKAVQDYRASGAIVQAELDQLNNQVADVQGALEAVSIQLIAAEPEAPVEELTRQQAVLQQQLTNLEEERSQLQNTARQLELTAELLREGNTAVTQRAGVPSTPISPQPLRNGVLAVVVGLILGVGFAFLREYLDDTVRAKEDVERASGALPVLALLPRVTSWKNESRAFLVTTEQPQSPASEAYRSLRTSLQFTAMDRPLKVIALTSSRSGEGKTTTSANLAVVFARSGQRVLAVDCDLRRPRLHQFFGLDNERGFTTAVIEGSMVGAVHELRDFGQLAVMPSGVVPPDPAELLASHRTVELFEKLLPHFDVIVVDSPPVLPVTDALVLSRVTDAMLLVAAAGETSKRDIHRSIELLAQVDAPVIGTVLNEVGVEAAYGYGYGSYGYTAKPTRRGRRKASRADNATMSSADYTPPSPEASPSEEPSPELPLSP